jgi:hypothetical protein
MKTTSSYNMKKEIKRILAVTSVEKRPFLKEMLIEAQLAEAKAKQAKLRDNSKPDVEA